MLKDCTNKVIQYKSSQVQLVSFSKVNKALSLRLCSVWFARLLIVLVFNHLFLPFLYLLHFLLCFVSFLLLAVPNLGCSELVTLYVPAILQIGSRKGYIIGFYCYPFRMYSIIYIIRNYIRQLGGNSVNIIYIAY